MNRIYRGWYFSDTGQKSENGNTLLRAAKGSEVIIGEYESIKLEIDQRTLKELQKMEE
ncbi:MAG: hypothetical protein IJB73_04290 [Firmicutes bacterium]|nr:hypothetical protein [Bacillota bacterium]MBQ6901143.1 hypothetical protein [Bacillota bacterium]